MSKVRMTIEVSESVADFLEKIAISEATTKTDMVRRALSVLKVYEAQKKKGRTHIGFTDDADKLDAELVGILDN